MIDIQYNFTINYINIIRALHLLTRNQRNKIVVYLLQERKAHL